MSKKLNKKGFTLIEVVLTIAIGALIFLLAFIAFRNAQVNRRDSQRRSDLDKISAEINNYASDKNGAVPTASDTSFSAFLTSYAATLKDPSSSTAYTGTAGNGDPTAIGTLTYAAVTTATGTAPATFCDGTPAATTRGTYVIKMKLEKGVACRDSSSN